MNKITLQTVVDALGHASDEQEKEFLRLANQNIWGWAGHSLEWIVKFHVQSMEDEAGPTQQELDEEAAEKRGA
jgi:hypothetical protein